MKTNLYKIYLVIIIILEIVFCYFYFLYGGILDFLKFQKIFLEVFILILLILGGKILYEFNSYIKDLKLEKLNENIKNLLEYSNSIDLMLGSINFVTKGVNFDVLKIFTVYFTMVKVVELNNNEESVEIYKNILNNIKFKLYILLLEKKYLKIEEGRIRFAYGLYNQIIFQVGNKKILDDILIDFSKMKNDYKD